jgi:hypothetical protein
VPDEVLAQQPIIVIGKWNKTALTNHSLVKGDGPLKVLQCEEVHTELIVQKVIKGDIKPGTHKILLGFRIGWLRKDGGPVMSFMSSEMVGDVDDVCDSNLWFLESKKSWDKTDTSTYLALETYRGVQPAVLEGYFNALASKNPKAEVPKLLSSEDPVVIERVLKFFCGGVLPWPYEANFVEEHQGVKRHEAMRQFAPEVLKLLERMQPNVRAWAAAVYAGLVGKDCVQRMRQLLRDSDPTIQAIIAGTLIRYGDHDSGEAICRVMADMKDGVLACQVIDLLADWKDPFAIPALIEFLQNDELAFQGDQGVPALKAQAVLKERTGFDFPTDVKSSRIAWEKAKAIADIKERAAYLGQILVHEPRPLVGEIQRKEKDTFLILTNRSKQTLSLTKEPSGIDCDWSNGMAGQSSPKKPKSPDDFTALAPGASLSLKLNSEWSARPGLKRVAVYYLHNGRDLGLNAWIGKVVTVVDSK